jgi:hypothetical protein
MEQELEGRDGFSLFEGRDVFAVMPMGTACREVLE